MSDHSSPAYNADLRRRHRRVSLLWAGQLQAPDGQDPKQAAPCAILNLSNGGARLRVADAKDCPAQVELECARFGRLAARVVWRRGNDLGLAFFGAPLKASGALAALLGSPAAAGA
jgi:hypothetical protein